MKLLKGNPYLLLLCAAALYFFVRGAPLALRFSVDFVPVYSGARCLLHGCNPYDTSQLEQQYVQAGGLRSELPAWHDEVPVYPPSTFLVLSPLALFRFSTARLLWMLLSGGLFVVSAAVILFTCPQRHRWLAATLVSITVATAGGPLALGQPAILAISLLIIGVCLLLRSRFLPLASFLLMLPAIQSGAAHPQGRAVKSRCYPARKDSKGATRMRRLGRRRQSQRMSGALGACTLVIPARSQRISRLARLKDAG